jgi:GTP-binding protein
VPVLVTSSVTRLGLGELTNAIIRQVPPAAEHDAGPSPGGDLPVALPEHRVFRPAAPRAYSVARTGEGTFSITGAGIERLLARYDLDNEEALAHLERRLRGIGVLRALEAEGFVAGDEVEIAGIAFDLDPNV